MRRVCSKAVACLLAAAITAGCLAICCSPVAEPTVISRRGDVRLGSLLLEPGDQVRTGDRLIAHDGDASLLLADGRRFHVYPHSEVVFRERQNRAMAWIARSIRAVRRRIGELGRAQNPIPAVSPVIAVRS
jgi:hypothetical protein